MGASYQPYNPSSLPPWAHYSQSQNQGLNSLLYANPTPYGNYQPPPPYMGPQDNFLQQLSQWGQYAPAVAPTPTPQPTPNPGGTQPGAGTQAPPTSPSGQGSQGGGGPTSAGSGQSAATSGNQFGQSILGNPAGVFGMTGLPATLTNLGLRQGLALLSPPLAGGLNMAGGLNALGQFISDQLNVAPQMSPQLADLSALATALNMGYGMNTANGAGANGVTSGVPGLSQGPMGSLNFSAASGLGGATGLSSTGVAYGGHGQSPNLNSPEAQAQNLSQNALFGGPPAPATNRDEGVAAPSATNADAAAAASAAAAAADAAAGQAAVSEGMDAGAAAAAADASGTGSAGAPGGGASGAGPGGGEGGDGGGPGGGDSGDRKGGIIKGPSTPPDSIKRRLTGGEFVVNKDATAAHRSELEAINRSPQEGGNAQFGDVLRQLVQVLMSQQGGSGNVNPSIRPPGLSGSPR